MEYLKQGQELNNQVKSIGGSFNMTQGTATTNGVFKARAGVQ
jgi:hypothetical protein